MELARDWQPQRVYNFEVETDHVYYVGGFEVLTHNSCGPNQKTAAAIRKSDNAMKDHLTDSDISGAVGDVLGNPIPKPGGGYYNHLQEVNEAMNGLYNNMGKLLKDGSKEAMEQIEKIKAMINKVNSAFEGLGI